MSFLYALSPRNKSMVSPLIDAGIPLHNVAILGGGDGGVCHDAFDDERADIINDDVFRFLDNHRRFDAIIYDLTMHPETFIDMDREVFLDRLFTKIKAGLKPSGMVTAQCCSHYDEETLKVAETIMKTFFSNVRFTKTYIPSYCTPWVFS